MDHGGGGMDMDMRSCKMQMLWNCRLQLASEADMLLANILALDFISLPSTFTADYKATCIIHPGMAAQGLLCAGTSPF